MINASVNDMTLSLTNLIDLYISEDFDPVLRPANCC